MIYTPAGLQLSPTQHDVTLTGSASWAIGNDLSNHIIGNAAANTLSGRGGDDIIEGGGGNDTLYGGLGSNRLTGGAGADTFIFDLQAGHHQVVTDFGQSGDHDALNISSFTNAGLAPTLTDTGLGTMLSFSNGETIELLGVSVSQLHATPTGFTI